ncbi:MAG: HAD family hydrolase [Lewinellaceae bacterium]|nr:HAD family hydrolase [Lewinellaceae bacterium]
MYLFLDRDGVINVRTPGDYVKRPEAFEFEAGALEALALLAPLFKRIVVVTNQSGVGKGIMSAADLEAVHAFMLKKIKMAGGRIDKVYYCPHRPSDGCDCRKPGTGMALQAQLDFPEIDFSRSVLVGDSVCDMKLAISLGMRTVLVEGKEEEAHELSALPVHYRYPTLLDFAKKLASMS